MLRVGLLGFLHESNTFAPVPTTYEHFAATSLTRGEELRERWLGKHHELSGLLAGCEESGLTVVPGMATYTVPGGAITAESFERLAAELIGSIALPLDGLLVALHGATASETYPDADGEILRRIRAVTGPDLPIICTLDLHANFSQAMAELATATIAYRTNPHLDQFARGREAAWLMARTLRGEVQPVQALETPPLLIQISRQHTNVEPARGLYADLETVLTWPGILSASVTMGFYYADVPEMGMGFLAVADGDEALARRAARWMSERAWARRAEFVGNLPTPAEAIAYAKETTRLPLVLMDVGDNVGAGSPADSTILLAEVLRQGARDALVVLYDPESVAQCVAAGVRHTVSLRVGGKTDALHGAPVAITGTVRTLSDGLFVEHQIRHGGWGHGDQGVTAVVETAEGHSIVLTSLRMPPMSLEQVLSLGLRPERKRILMAKGVVAPRAAYEPVAGEILLVDTPGVTSDNPAVFNYRRRRKPLFPLES
ncbi:MAG: M81 family metallopeptidase [Bryobacteraceae bacterium]|nr:M81 family metallopeptidase [Bryobacteraceae bacterium]